MTQEDANTLYGENSWSLYKFEPNRKSVITELLLFNNTHCDNTWLDVCFDDGLLEGDYILSVEAITVCLYYRERDIVVDEEIRANRTLHGSWTGSDCFDLEPEDVHNLKRRTRLARFILQKLLQLNGQFVDMVKNP